LYFPIEKSKKIEKNTCPVTRPETRLVTQLETQLETQPEIQLEIQPEIQLEILFCLFISFICYYSCLSAFLFLSLGMEINRNYTEIKQAAKLTKGQVSTIFSYVEESLIIQLTEKGKKTIKGDLYRQMLKFNNDTDKVMTYFKNYSQEMQKLYQWGWDTYERAALISMLTRR